MAPSETPMMRVASWILLDRGPSRLPPQSIILLPSPVQLVGRPASFTPEPRAWRLRLSVHVSKRLSGLARGFITFSRAGARFRKVLGRDRFSDGIRAGHVMSVNRQLPD